MSKKMKAVRELVGQKVTVVYASDYQLTLETFQGETVKVYPSLYEDEDAQILGLEFRVGTESG